MQSHWGVRELLVTLKLPYLIVLQTQPPYKGLSLPQGSGQTSEPYRGCATHPCSPPGGVSALPGAPEARSHLLLSFPSTSEQPQCSKCLLTPLRAAPQSFLLQNIAYGEGRGRCRAQTSSPNFSCCCYGCFSFSIAVSVTDCCTLSPWELLPVVAGAREAKR